MAMVILKYGTRRLQRHLSPSKSLQIGYALSNLTAGCVSIHSIEHLWPKSSRILAQPVMIMVGLQLADAQ